MKAVELIVGSFFRDILIRTLACLRASQNLHWCQIVLPKQASTKAQMKRLKTASSAAKGGQCKWMVKIFESGLVSAILSPRRGSLIDLKYRIGKGCRNVTTVLQQFMVGCTCLRAEGSLQ